MQPQNKKVSPELLWQANVSARLPMTQVPVHFVGTEPGTWLHIV